ncbi:MAG TPA: BTAD domain-containing putative transcriptional regulator, partial [Gemmatimonadaceae bacterium]|nr:BTAD domain-containing putative transcriptional regulator [Gemmatimonadaceae bacterium]
MIRLRTLGAIDLRAADGRELSSLLAQPKRMALLIYLAIARPHGYHRRDRLVALFWPESDQTRARQALSKAVHQLRRVLGENALLSRGDDELSLNDALVECDARQLDEAFAAGDHARVLELYGGDLAVGLFVDDAPDLEHWLDDERSRIRHAAAVAATTLADDAIRRGQAATAVEYARQAAAFSPDDEPVTRLLMAAHVAAGDRAGALRAYEHFAARLRAELDSDPSAETVALAQSIRSRDLPNVGQAATAEPAPSLEQPTAASPAKISITPPLSVVRRSWRRPVMAALFVAAVVVLGTSLRGRTADTAATTVPKMLHEDRVLVAVLDNRTGDSTLEAVGTMAMDFMTQGISSAALVEVVDPSGAVLAARGVDTLVGRTVDPATMARALAIESGAGLVISGAYYREGDSLRFRVSLSDVTRSTVARSFQLVSAHVREPTAALSDLRRQAIDVIAEAVEPRLLEFSRGSPKPPSYPAYLEYVRGIDLYTHRQESAAVPHFVRAFELDTSFTLALLNATVAAISVQDDRANRWIDALNGRRETLPRIQQLWLDAYLASRAGNREEAYRIHGEL